MGETSGNTRERARDTRAKCTRKCTRERNLDPREFTKPRRRRGGQRRLKYEFIFYVRISRDSKVILFVSHHCRNCLETEYGTQHKIRNLNFRHYPSWFALFTQRSIWSFYVVAF